MAMPTDRGRLFDTYVAALQHDLVDLPDGTSKVGVVRRPTRWLHPRVDENIAALGPLTELLDAFRDRQTELAEAGLSDASAHNQAWEDVDYTRRYRKHIAADPDAQAALEQIEAWLEDGRDVALVCYENTDEKRCHRTILREYLE